MLPAGNARVERGLTRVTVRGSDLGPKVLESLATGQAGEPGMGRDEGVDPLGVLPRQIAMYLTRNLTRHSLPEIGKAFGGKDHTTVLYACKKIEESLNQDSEIKYIVEKLSTILKQ